MDDKTETALIYVLIFAALATVYGLLGLIAAALLCRVFGWPFGNVWPYVAAAAVSTSFVQLRWHAMTYRDQPEDEPSACKDDKDKASLWENAAAVILAFVALTIMFGFLGMLPVAVSHFVFGQPVTVGLLALVAGCSACAAAVWLWWFLKTNPDTL